MERLTDRNADGNYFYPKCFEKCDGFGSSSKCDNCEIMTSICEKLGKYEDLDEQGRRDSRQTNADRIRNMSDEELAEFIEQISTDSMETISFGTKEYKEIWERKETALEWLQSEAE